MEFSGPEDTWMIFVRARMLRSIRWKNPGRLFAGTAVRPLAERGDGGSDSWTRWMANYSGFWFQLFHSPILGMIN